MYLKKTAQLPNQQTNAFKMYVKKEWYGFPVVLLLLFLVVISCNRQIQHTPNLSQKVKPTKTEVNTSKEPQTGKAPIEGEKPKYGTYFTNLAPEYAWLDTLTVEDLIQNKWIEYRKDEHNKNTEETLHLGSGYFKKTFTDKLPTIPIDSFMIYTAHWYGIDNDFSFDSKDISTNYYLSRYYKQYYEGTEISDHYVSVKFDLQRLKPTTFQLYLARNLNLNLIDKPFPYDSLYVLASDSLRMSNGNKYDEFFYDVYEYTDDTFKYNPLEYPLNEKYRKKYIRFDGSNYSFVTEINIYGDNKLYEFIFDMQTIKLLSVANRMNHLNNESD